MGRAVVPDVYSTQATFSGEMSGSAALAASISASGGSVAFLPGEARTVAWALHEARRIGVIQGPAENARYYRFPVIVLAEVPPQSSVEKPNVTP